MSYLDPSQIWLESIKMKLNVVLGLSELVAHYDTSVTSGPACQFSKDWKSDLLIMAFDIYICTAFLIYICTYW